MSLPLCGHRGNGAVRAPFVPQLPLLPHAPPALPPLATTLIKLLLCLVQALLQVRRPHVKKQARVGKPLLTQGRPFRHEPIQLPQRRRFDARVVQRCQLRRPRGRREQFAVRRRLSTRRCQNKHRHQQRPQPHCQHETRVAATTCASSLTTPFPPPPHVYIPSHTLPSRRTPPVLHHGVHSRTAGANPCVLPPHRPQRRLRLPRRKPQHFAGVHTAVAQLVQRPRHAGPATRTQPCQPTAQHTQSHTNRTPSAPALCDVVQYAQRLTAAAIERRHSRVFSTCPHAPLREWHAVVGEDVR